MQALQNSLQNIREQLGKLSPTAKLLIGALMVILAMTLFLVAQYSSRNALEPLGLASNLSSDARTRAMAHIRNSGIPHRERGGEIFVPSDQRYTILAQLTDGDVISADQINFDSLIEQDSPFLSKSQNDRRWLIATMNVLGRTISGMNGIQRATVLIDEPRHAGGIGAAHIPASASVNVLTRGEPLTQARVDAIAALVAGAHAGLRVENVVVIDSNLGRMFRARGDESHNVTTNLELQLSQERLVREKLVESLSYIPGVNVAVHATVDTREIVQQKRSFDEPRLGVTTESSRLLSSTNEMRGGEAGVRPNTGANIAPTTGRGSSMTDERNEAAMVPAFGGTDSRIVDSRGHALLINATVGVPRSYFVRLYQNEQDGEAAQPDPAALAALVADETARIRSQIEPLIDTRAVDGAVAGTVIVSMIPDFAMSALMNTGSGGGGAVAESASTFGAMASNEGLIKYVGLGALAIISLAMMFMLVRKASAPQEMPSAAELAGVPPTFGDQDAELVGEAGEPLSSMEGVEVDETDMRRRQMLGQINDMAKKNPVEAATLIRRWMRAEAA